MDSEVKIISMGEQSLSIVTPAGTFHELPTDIDVDDIAVTVFTDYQDELEVGRKALAEVTAAVHKEQTLTGGDETTAQLFESFLETHEATETLKASDALLAEFRRDELHHLKKSAGAYPLATLLQRSLRLRAYDVSKELLSWPPENFAIGTITAQDLASRDAASLLHGCPADLLEALRKRCVDSPEDFAIAHASLAINAQDEPAASWINEHIHAASAPELADCTDTHEAEHVWLSCPGIDTLYERNPIAVQLLVASKAQKLGFDQPLELGRNISQTLGQHIARYHRVGLRGQDVYLPYDASTTLAELRQNLATTLSVDLDAIWIVDEKPEALEVTVARLAELNPDDKEARWSPASAKEHFAPRVKNAVKIFDQFDESKRWSTTELIKLVANKMREFDDFEQPSRFDDSVRVAELPKLIIHYIPDGVVAEQQELEIDPRWIRPSEDKLGEID